MIMFFWYIIWINGEFNCILVNVRGLDIDEKRKK